MKYYNLLFFNQSFDYKNKKHKVVKETKNFVWLQNDQSDNIIKVSKKTNRVWIIKDSYSFETAKCNILEEIKLSL